jgi:hypothetical protein
MAKIILGPIEVRKSLVGRGITQYTAFCELVPMPLGFVWGVEFGGDRPFMHIWDSYVLEWARRLGVRTAINETILKDNEVIITGGRTAEGIAFMKARGYTFDQRLDQWSLVREAQV